MLRPKKTLPLSFENNELLLEQILKLTQKELKEVLHQALKRFGYHPQNQNGFLYGKGTIPVLLVAHLDTMHKTPVKTICRSKDGVWMSPEGIGGDDRAGVYMILKLLQTFQCHVLFCEDEELGGIGAWKFTKSNTSLDVHYIVELDRCGKNDAVFYDCDNSQFTDFVLRHGFVMNTGTFSDISVISPHFGIAAVNISAGYFNEHSRHESIQIHYVEKNIERVKNMIATPTEKFKYMEAKFESLNAPSHLSEIFQERLLMEFSKYSYVLSNGKLEDDTGYYIDKDGIVYEIYDFLDWCGAVAAPVPDAIAYSASHLPLRFNTNKACMIVVAEEDDLSEVYENLRTE